MQANELRIGNWVCFSEEGLQFTVTEITPEGLGVINELEGTWIEINNFSGIPLSLDWLIKANFMVGDRQDRDGNTLYILDNFCLGFKDGKFFFMDTMLTEDERVYELVITPIDYVHELQNLFFALYKKEIEL